MNHDIPVQSLRKATVGALAGAALILALFVLPAERGIDITGIGAALGLTRMSEPAEATDENPAPAVPMGTADIPAQTKQTILKTTPLRADEMTLVLPPHSGAEIKARMKQGDHFIFNWAADGGKIKFDMHGEPLGGRNEFTSYWKEKDLLSAQGSFTAPFTGTHGWYWRNRGDEPVTIKIKTTGFYETLYQPK